MLMVLAQWEKDYQTMSFFASFGVWKLSVPSIGAFLHMYMQARCTCTFSDKNASLLHKSRIFMCPRFVSLAFAAKMILYSYFYARNRLRSVRIVRMQKKDRDNLSIKWNDLGRGRSNEWMFCNPVCPSLRRAWRKRSFYAAEKVKNYRSRCDWCNKMLFDPKRVLACEIYWNAEAPANAVIIYLYCCKSHTCRNYIDSII